MPEIRKMLVASSKGGVGKSTTALGLAAAFASLGKTTLLMDLDSTSRSLDLLTGCEDRAIFSFSDILTGMEPEKAVLTPFSDLPELLFLPASTPRRMRELATERGQEHGELIREGIKRLGEWNGYEYLVCDSGGGLDDACEAAACFDFALIASAQSQTSVRAAEYAASRLERTFTGKMRLCICSFDLSAVKKENRAGVIEMIDASSLPCVGVIPFDKSLQRAQDAGELPGKKSPVTAACRNIARRIMGRETPLFEGITPLYRQRRGAL